MKQLPVAARLYVSAVIAGGALLLAAFFPLQEFRHPLWFVTLLLLSSITSAFKVNLPLARSGSTMSVSYAVDFLSLILLGPAQTMIVGAMALVGDRTALAAAASGDVWVAYPMNPAPGQQWVPIAWLALGAIGTGVQLGITGGEKGRVRRKKKA